MNISHAQAEFGTGRLAPPKASAQRNKTGFGPFDFLNVERQFLLAEERHAERLAAAAAQALRDARYHDAFMYADRRCRIKPIAGSDEYLLRAGALSQLGERTLAAKDLKTALEIDPNHTLANLTALRAASGRERLSFATAIIQNDTNSTALGEAIVAVAALGCTAIGAFRATPDGVIGWLAWRGNPDLQLQLLCDSGAQSLSISGIATHHLTKVLGHAADIFVRWPSDWTYLKVGVTEHSSLLANATLLPPQRPPVPRPNIKHSAAEVASVAIVIPVYGDPDATQRCLKSVMQDRTDLTNARIVLVDDASPDKRIQTLVKELSADSKVSLVVHKTNLGFAHSINDALAALGDEDVVLLNADTVVPRGFIARLRRAAYSAPDIGTVTPLSNNGEYTSFPVPFCENPLPEIEEITALDRLAEKENGGQVIDMPNGTAFCMYVRRNCLDAVGTLSTTFGKGYYEDVEFCLRAAHSGFRNVCAADVFVGHAGSKSFGKSKRALVTRNLAALESAFPQYRAISATFIDDDPLAPARLAIERAVIHAGSHVYRLSLGCRENDQLLSYIQKSAESRSERSLIGDVRLSAGRIIFSMAAADGNIPQNIKHDFPAGDALLIANLLKEFRIAQIDIFDLEELPPAFIDAVFDKRFSVCLFLPSGRARAVVAAMNTVTPPDSEDGERERMWMLAIARSETVIVNDEETRQLLIQRFGKNKKIVALCTSPREKRLPSLAGPQHTGTRLGVIGGKGAATQSVLAQLINHASPPLRPDVVFLGAAFEELRLMSGGRIFCTGDVNSTDLTDTARLYEASHLLVIDERRTIGADLTALPVAYLDPVATCPETSKNGILILPTGASISTIVTALNRWTTEIPGAAYG